MVMVEQVRKDAFGITWISSFMLSFFLNLSFFSVFFPLCVLMVEGSWQAVIAWYIDISCWRGLHWRGDGGWRWGVCSVVRRDKDLCVSVEDDGLHGGQGFVCACLCLRLSMVCSFVSLRTRWKHGSTFIFIKSNWKRSLNKANVCEWESQGINFNSL